MKGLLCILLLLISSFNVQSDKDRYVLNKGFPGNNVSNLLRRLRRAVLKHKPDLVIIMIGTNDMVNPRKMLSYQVFREKLRLVVDSIRKNGASVLLLAPPDVDEGYLYARHGRDKYEIPPNKKMDSVRSIIHGISEMQHCMYLDIDSLFASRHSPDRTISSLIRNEANSGKKDGVHPTAAGYRLMAESIFSFLKSKGVSYKRIICFGDSITFGAFVSGQGTTRGDTYPAILKDLLMAD